MENLGIFYDHLVYLTSIGNIVWPFGIFCGHLECFSSFWYFEKEKLATLLPFPQALWPAEDKRARKVSGNFWPLPYKH
jgi:hypothetical protein